MGRLGALLCLLWGLAGCTATGVRLDESDGAVADRPVVDTGAADTGPDAGDPMDVWIDVDIGPPPDTGPEDTGPGPDAGPIDCPSLARDDCIATAGCVLDGSEVLDPQYFCRAAASPCEGIADREACADTPGCLAHPGQCYCPEGLECACAGGPAPVCREWCGGIGNVQCPADFFCDYEGAPNQICTTIPDNGGSCVPVPPTCEGTPPQPVCGCDGPNQESFRNDCLRRMARHSRGLAQVCP